MLFIVLVIFALMISGRRDDFHASCRSKKDKGKAMALSSLELFEFPSFRLSSHQ